jgi:hypothetical protein
MVGLGTFIAGFIIGGSTGIFLMAIIIGGKNE